MSEVKSLKEKTTKMVHSLLLAGAHALTLRQLENDYKAMVGEKIPFRSMGYSSLELFLRDDPEHFKLYWNGPHLTVKHVTNEETQHIEQMINRQKRKPGDGRRQARPQFRRYPQPRIQPEKLKPMVSSINRGQIKGLLWDYPSGLLGSNFAEAFSRRFGQPLMFRAMGFSSQLELLESMPDIVHIQQEPSGMYRIYPKTTRKTTILHSTGPAAPSREAQKSPSTKKPSPKRYTSGSQNQYSQQSRQSQNDRTEQRQQPASSAPEEESWVDDPYDASGVNRVVQMEIAKVLSNLPEGLWSKEFPARYRKTFNKDLDLRAQGYNSVINLMSALPNVVTIIRQSQTDWLLFDSRLKQQEPPSNQKKLKVNEDKPPSHGLLSTAPPVNEEETETIRQVVAYHSEGVVLGELPGAYQILVGKKLDHKQLGFATMEALVIALNEVIHMEYRGEGRVLLFPQYREHVPCRDKLLALKTSQVESYEPPRPVPVDAVVSYEPPRLVPVDAVGPGATFKIQKLPPDLMTQETPYIWVYIATVSNPGNFWLQLKGAETTEALETIMDELEMVYTSKKCAQEYTLPDEFVKIGQICAAVYPLDQDEDWHRCYVTGFRGSDFVEVFYVDYGSTYVVNKRSLKFLRSKFLHLPAQAIKGRLANVSPVERGEWTRNSKQRMLSMVSNRPLVALVTEISEEGVISVCLTDTSDSENDVHINDLLVTEGLAKMDEAAELPPQEQPQLEPEEKSGQASSVPTVIRPIKHCQLTPEFGFHIINYDGKAYVTCGEVSNLLWPGKDILRSMMRQRKLNLSRTVVLKEDQVQLFQEFFEAEVGGTLDSDNNVKSHVTLFELTSVLEILDVFKHPCEELHDSIRRQLDLFNPHDAFWKGEDDPDSQDDLEDEEDEDEEEFIYGRQTLETALQSLQFRRKRILQGMQAMDAANSVTLVEDLQNVEHQLGDIKKRIRELERLERSQKDEVKSSCSKKLTEEEELVCDVISEQQDSYLEINRPDFMMSSKTSPKVSPMKDKKTNPVAPMPAAESKTESVPKRKLTDLISDVSGLSLSSATTGPGGGAGLGEVCSGGGLPSQQTLPMSVLVQQYQQNLLAMQQMYGNLQQGAASAYSPWMYPPPPTVPGNTQPPGNMQPPNASKFPSSVYVPSASHLTSNAHLPKASQLPSASQLPTTAQLPSNAQFPSASHLSSTSQLPSNTQLANASHLPITSRLPPNMSQLPPQHPSLTVFHGQSVQLPSPDQLHGFPLQAFGQGSLQTPPVMSPFSFHADSFFPAMVPMRAPYPQQQPRDMAPPCNPPRFPTNP